MEIGKWIRNPTIDSQKNDLNFRRFGVLRAIITLSKKILIDYKNYVKTKANWLEIPIECELEYI